MISPPRVHGYVDRSGVEWVAVEHKGKEALVLHEEFAGSSAAAFKLLARQGVTIVSKAACNRVIEDVAKLDFSTVRNFVAHSGWSGGCFALPDGTIFAPDGVDAECAFETKPDKCEKRGSLKGWKLGVAVPLTGQALPMFMLMFAFMPPLLRLTSRADNFGFELVGPGGTGKTTMQRLMASIFGGTGQGDDGCYWITFDTTLNALENQMSVYSDLPIPIEEAAHYLADESQAKRAAALKAFAFKMSGGTHKDRQTCPAAKEHRFSYFSSSNDRLIDLIGRASDVARAAIDRLITLNVDASGPYGVFADLPEGFASSSQFAEALKAAARDHHGVAGRHFLRKLVDTRAAGEEALRVRIRNLVKRFHAKAGVDLNNGSDMRVAEAFGLVYAAGEIAKEFGALPKSWKCGPAALKCYREFRHGAPPYVPPRERLLELSKADGTVRLDRPTRRATAAQIEAASVFVYQGQKGRELLIRTPAIEEVIPDWKYVRAQFKPLMRPEGKRWDNKCKLTRGGKSERVFVFKLPKQR